MEDVLLDLLFEPQRWEEGIDVGVGKHISKAELRILCAPQTRLALYRAIRDDKYVIAPSHTALIPKDEPGEFREVMICENIDRILLSIINNLFFEVFPEFVHPSCYSYKKGIGTGKVIKNVSKVLQELTDFILGFKYDMRKYFDSCKIELIDEVFDRMENKRVDGKYPYKGSKVIKIVRDFYHCNLLFDEKGNLKEIYKSIKQGTPTSSFLADAILYKVDKEMSNFEDVHYWRYSDDILLLGKNYKAADEILRERLGEMGLMINPKKEELLTKDKFFKFLGFSLRGNEISLSKTRLKKFQKEIETRTTKNRKATFKSAINSVNRFLYVGDGQYSWATSVLPVINVQEDIDTLNKFVMDSLRAVKTGKKKVGGLGYETNRKSGVITRGRGKNVTANRAKVEHIDGYLTISCMQKNMLSNREVYETLVRQL